MPRSPEKRITARVMASESCVSRLPARCRRRITMCTRVSTMDNGQPSGLSGAGTGSHYGPDSYNGVAVPRTKEMTKFEFL